MASSFWSGKRVFVTGANGFVGSWLCKRLIDEGAAVVALIRDHIPEANFFRLGLDRYCDIVRGCIEDFTVVSRIIHEYEVEICFHLAAQSIIGIANQIPCHTFETNVRGTWNLFEALRLGKAVQGVVVASSDKAYGCHEMLPYTEDTPLLPHYPYDTSKACADLIARCYFHTFGLPVTITRFANIYGGGDLNFSRIVPGTIRSVLLGENPVIRSDGTPERDFIHVDDVVDLYLEIGRRLPDKAVAGEVFNGGHNKPVQVLSLVEKIIDLSGVKGIRPKIMGKGIQGEIDRQWLDATKAKVVLGWQPRIGLEDGLLRTIAWYREIIKG